MLRIYPIVLEVLKQLQPALRRIEVQDRDLARQLRRASASIALNLGEGMYSRGQNRHARYLRIPSHSSSRSGRTRASIPTHSSRLGAKRRVWFRGLGLRPLWLEGFRPCGDASSVRGARSRGRCAPGGRRSRPRLSGRQGLRAKFSSVAAT
jgi:hypothetical protein